MDRTTMIVVGICAILLYFTWPSSKNVELQQQINSNTEQVKTVNKNGTSGSQKVADINIIKTTFAPIILENNEIIATFDANIGGFTKFTFKNFKDADGLEKYSMGNATNPFFALKKENFNFVTDKVEKVNDKTIYISQKMSATELYFNREITVNDSYNFSLKMTIENKGEVLVSLDNLNINAGTSLPLVAGNSSYIYGGGENQRISWSEKEKVVSEKLNSIEKSNELSKILMTGWIATENRYFCSILIAGAANKPFSGINFLTEHLPNAKKEIALSAEGIFGLPTLLKGQISEINFSAYVGPKQYENLLNLGSGQEDLLDLGWFWIRPISKIVLKSLIWLHSVGLTYALAIILITVIIKAVFWPITHKSSVSMKKISELQPKIKAMREQFKDNPQMLQMKTMELYRENKVNPLGGCLPMLIQIPVFFALYSTFRSAVELRGADFLWCKDLANPDTVAQIFSLNINPLALIMVVSMLAQQLLTPSTGDANQRKIMLIMPVVMLFFMYDMPAGLTLYWTVNQLLSIIQQSFTNKALKKSKTA